LVRLKATILGNIIFYIIPIRRKVTLQNLAQAFPEKSAKERWKIAKACYCHFSKLVFEVFKFSTYDKNELAQMVSIPDIALFDELQKKERGGLLVCGHFGNWELFGNLLTKMGFKISAIYQRQRNPLVTQLIDEMRTKTGINTIRRSKTMRGIIKALKDNHIVTVLVDQDAGENGTFVDFFGRKASTAKGPATLALRFNTPIIMGYPIRLKDNTFLGLVEILAIQGKSEDQIVQLYTSALEKMIRQYPEQWFWMHRRWKTSERLGIF